MPIHKEVAEDDKKAPEEDAPKIVTKTIILPDGSYGTETVVVDQTTKKDDEEDFPLRKCLQSAEDDFLSSCLSISMTKLTVKMKKNLQVKKFNAMAVETSLVICSLLKGEKKIADANYTQRM